MLADRVSRTRLLGFSVAAWGVAMIATGSVGSFGWMLAARIGLGVVTATAGPATASLVGDIAAPEQRGRIYSRILLGELAGAGVGLVGSGEVAAFAGWRWAFWWLALPSAVLAWLLVRLAEPARRSRRAESADPTPDPEPGHGAGPAGWRCVAIRTG